MKMTVPRVLIPLAVIAVLFGGSVGAASAQEPAHEQIEYNRDVRPVLARACLACHGPSEGTRQADLRARHRRVHRPGHRARRRRGEPAVPAADHRRPSGEDAAGVVGAVADRRPDRPRAPVDRRRRGVGRRARRRRGRRAGDARAGRRLRPRGPADPVPELLHVPRARRAGAPARPAARRRGGALCGPRPVRRSGHRARRRRREPAHPPGERRRRPGADALPARPEHPGHAGRRRGRAERGRDRDPAAVDRPGGRVAVALGVHPARAAGGAPGGGHRVAAQPHRQLRAGRPRGRRAVPRGRGRPGDAAAPGELRPDGPAAARGRHGRVPQRRLARRLRERRRPHCWGRPRTASGWPSTGSTRPATPTRAAIRPTPSGRCGATATGSSTPTTRTCRSTSSRSSRSRATCCPTRPSSSASPPRSTGTTARTARAASSPRSSWSRTWSTGCRRRERCGWA